MINSRKLFDDSETAHPITEDAMIKIEKIHGTLLLIGAEDDVLWDTAKYIRRMKQRVKDHPHTCKLIREQSASGQRKKQLTIF